MLNKCINGRFLSALLVICFFIILLSQLAVLYNNKKFPAGNFLFESVLLNISKCLLQVGNQIINMFRSNGKTNGIWIDSLIPHLFFRQLRMRRRSRMDHQGFDIRYIG